MGKCALRKVGGQRRGHAQTLGSRTHTESKIPNRHLKHQAQRACGSQPGVRGAEPREQTHDQPASSANPNGVPSIPARRGRNLVAVRRV